LRGSFEICTAHGWDEIKGKEGKGKPSPFHLALQGKQQDTKPRKQTRPKT